MSERKKSYIEQICPECVFQPTYPQIFKFDLFLNSQNYGELEIVIKEGIEIEEIKGDPKAIKKLEEVGKAHNGTYFEEAPCGVYSHTIEYPFKTLMDLVILLWVIKLTQTKEQNAQLRNKDYSRMVIFNSNMFSPINKKILYEKTGIKIQY